MPVTIPPPAPKVISIPGDAITIQLRSIPGVDTEVIWHITRNGAREERFSLDEMTQVLAQSNTLLAQARSRQLNSPRKTT
jgi:hypothetical protein